MAFLKEVEEGSFKGKVQSVCMCEWGGGFFFPEGKGKVPCDGSLWVPRMIYKKKILKKFHTSYHASLLLPFSENQSWR